MNADATQDKFLTIVSHELLTPTAAIIGWAEWLGRTAVDDERLAHGIEVIKRNAQLQAQLIEHLIDFSQVSKDDFRLDLQRITILPTVKAAIEAMLPLAFVKDIKIVAQLSPVSGWIIGDTFRLQQVFTNLISNAIKCTPSGGDIRVLLLDDGTWVEVKVSDTGKGISAELLPDIFEGSRRADNGSRSQSGGLGLGLNISRRLIERHGGRINAFSKGSGQGATFTVQLPRTDVNGDH